MGRDSKPQPLSIEMADDEPTKTTPVVEDLVELTNEEIPEALVKEDVPAFVPGRLPKVINSDYIDFLKGQAKLKGK